MSLKLLYSNSITLKNLHLSFICFTISENIQVAYANVSFTWVIFFRDLQNAGNSGHIQIITFLFFNVYTCFEGLVFCFLLLFCFEWEKWGFFKLIARYSENIFTFALASLSNFRILPILEVLIQLNRSRFINMKLHNCETG